MTDTSFCHAGLFFEQEEKDRGTREVRCLIEMQDERQNRTSGAVNGECSRCGSTEVRTDGRVTHRNGSGSPLKKQSVDKCD